MSPSEITGPATRGGRGRWWLARIGGALSDQALFAGSSFILNVLLARWMSPSEYGAFVVAYSWFLLPQNLYDALLIEPMSVYGAGIYAGRFQRYLGLLYRGHVALSLVILAALGAAALVASRFDSGLMGGALAGAALASPLLLTRWLTRQPFYVLSVPHRATFGGAIYLALAVLATVILFHSGTLNPFNAMLAQGLASVTAAAVLTTVLLRPQFRAAASDDDLTTGRVIAQHWAYGKWASAERLLAWFPANIYYLALPLLVGLDASAALRAMLNLIMPLLMTIGAINGVMLPMFVRTLANQGQPALDRLLASIVRWAVLAAVAWSVFITFLGEFVISWLYNGQYDSYVTPLMLFIMGLIPVVAAFNRIVDTALRAMGGVRRAFFSRLLPTILTMTMGLGLVAAFGIIGAHASSVLTGAVTMVILIRFYRLQKQEREKAT